MRKCHNYMNNYLIIWSKDVRITSSVVIADVPTPERNVS